MRWTRNAGKILATLFGGVIIGTVLIGLFAFLVSGKDGLVNGLIWGAAMGLVGGGGAVGYQIYALYWSDFAGEVGDAVNDPNRDPDWKLGQKKK